MEWFFALAFYVFLKSKDKTLQLNFDQTMNFDWLYGNEIVLCVRTTVSWQGVYTNAAMEVVRLCGPFVQNIRTNYCSPVDRYLEV